jgi:hypothetical protein
LPHESVRLTPSLAPSSVGVSTVVRALQARSEGATVSGTQAQAGSMGASFCHWPRSQRRGTIRKLVHVVEQGAAIKSRSLAPSGAHSRGRSGAADRAGGGAGVGSVTRDASPATGTLAPDGAGAAPPQPDVASANSATFQFLRATAG